MTAAITRPSESASWRRPLAAWVLAIPLLAAAADGAAAGSARRTAPPLDFPQLTCRSFGDANGVPATPDVSRVRKGDPAYMEFRQRRSRQILPGHLYIAFGRLDPAGKPATRQFIGLHPVHFADTIMSASGDGAAAELEPSVKDCTFPVRAAYRVSLTSAQYRALLRKVSTALSTRPRWNVARYNCNSFASDLGKVAGLKPVGDAMTPSATYIRAYIRLNEGGR